MFTSDALKTLQDICENKLFDIEGKQYSTKKMSKNYFLEQLEKLANEGTLSFFVDRFNQIKIDPSKLENLVKIDITFQLLSDITSIYFDEYGNAYASTGKARLVSSSSGDDIIPMNDVCQQIISIDIKPWCDCWKDSIIHRKDIQL